MSHSFSARKSSYRVLSLKRSDIGVAKVSFLPSVPRLKMASTVAKRESCEYSTCKTWLGLAKGETRSEHCLNYLKQHDSAVI